MANSLDSTMSMVGIGLAAVIAGLTLYMIFQPSQPVNIWDYQQHYEFMDNNIQSNY